MVEVRVSDQDPHHLVWLGPEDAVVEAWIGERRVPREDLAYRHA